MELLEIIRNPIIAALLASTACGIVGVYVVVKRIVFISGGISHASFGGIGLGYFFSIVTRRTRLPEDTAIGVLWVFGMALGILLVFLTPGFAPDLMVYLFGDILFVSAKEITMMLILDGVIILTVSLLYKEFLALCFDEEFSTAIGIPTERLYLTLLCLVALTVVVLIRVVGIIMVIALLTIPAAMSRQFTHDLRKMMLLSILFSIIFTVGGLWLSYFLRWPSGATIILFGVVLFLASLAFSRLRQSKSVSLPQ
jgi:zinc transport system permease protein